MLDTNAVGVLLADQNAPWARYGRHIGSIGVSSIVLFELRYGIAKSRTAKANAAALDKFLGGGIEVVAFDTDDAAEAGVLRHRMEAKGRPMGPFDLLIAAQVLRLGATLVTRDAAFTKVDGLKVEDWTA